MATLASRRTPPGEAIRGSSTALDPAPTSQVDPSRSLSFAFGTALPAPLGTLPSAVGVSVAGKRLPEIFPARSRFKAWAALGLESRSARLLLGQADSR
jgi:hypothetical protein